MLTHSMWIVDIFCFNLLLVDVYGGENLRFRIQLPCFATDHLMREPNANTSAWGFGVILLEYDQSFPFR